MIMAHVSTEAEELQRRMQEVRMNLGVEMHDLVENARTIADWRHYWRTHPWACCGAAAAIGFLVVPSRRSEPYDARSVAELANMYDAKLKGIPGSRKGLAGQLAGMAIGVAVQAGLRVL